MVVKTIPYLFKKKFKKKIKKKKRFSSVLENNYPDQEQNRNSGFSEREEEIAKRFVILCFIQRLEKICSDGVGMGDVRRNGGVGIIDSVGMGGSLVLEHKTLQRVRREESSGSDHIQRRFCLLLQSTSARSLRDNPYSFQRVNSNLHYCYCCSYFNFTVNLISCDVFFFWLLRKCENCWEIGIYRVTKLSCDYLLLVVYLWGHSNLLYDIAAETLWNAK